MTKKIISSEIPIPLEVVLLKKTKRLLHESPDIVELILKEALNHLNCILFSNIWGHCIYTKSNPNEELQSTIGEVAKNIVKYIQERPHIIEKAIKSQKNNKSIAHRLL